MAGGRNGGEFSLLDEGWIRVMRDDCSAEEVPLAEAIAGAHRFRGLAGETRTQDAAVLRVLLAALYAALAKPEPGAGPPGALDEDGALRRWAELWDAGRFPEGPVLEYLEANREGFFLFHPERPFFQRPEAAKGTRFGATKLNGEILASENKPRLFAQRAGEGARTLGYAEAARWLLHANGFDDSGLKRGGGLPSPGVGWLGKLGIVYAEGGNLFETLMLNLALLKDGESPWEAGRPAWEDASPKRQRRRIACPGSPAELLTLQSRLLLLEREGGRVTGYHDLGGDHFDPEGAFAEQMTAWGRQEKGGEEIWLPKPHDPSRQMWRDAERLMAQEGSGRAPGVVRWISRLRKEEILAPDARVTFRTAGVRYDAKRCSVTDSFGDSLAFAASLLDAGWRAMAVKEADRCRRMAGALGLLASDIAAAQGAGPDARAARAGRAREGLYAALDAPFREWIGGLKPWEDSLDEKKEEWARFAGRAARKAGWEAALGAGKTAFAGRSCTADGKERHCSTPEALDLFLRREAAAEQGR